ncbi:MARVEL domain-containing protein 3-like isoform X2 [Petaurus breviceps papuanus]|uniref:MARVEL domain-containing protein 3-like isoform X2 n=1 Tax=Petaurus breviceps papuanus TaxID=3040969 RepID=UPI0036D76CB0
MPAVFKHPPNWQTRGQETSQLNNPHDKRTAKKLHTPNVRYIQSIPHGQYSRMAVHHSQTVLRAPVAGPQYLNSLSHKPHQKPGPGRCSTLSSSRGLLQLAELSLSLLVLICVASAQSTSPGFFSLGGLRGYPYFALGFLGDELSQLTELDLQYHRMKLPAGYYLVGVSCLLLCLALAFLILGCSTSVPEARMLLGVELVTDVLGVLACMLAIGLYVHSIQSANASEVCEQREVIYRSAGYTSVTCVILGTEVAACTFAGLLTMVYFSGMICVGLSLRKESS